MQEQQEQQQRDNKDQGAVERAQNIKRIQLHSAPGAVMVLHTQERQREREQRMEHPKVPKKNNSCKSLRRLLLFYTTPTTTTQEVFQARPEWKRVPENKLYLFAVLFGT